MNFLFVHQNFPGQFRHMARALAADPAHQVVGLGDAQAPPQAPLHPRLRVLGYQPQELDRRTGHHYLQRFQGEVRRGQAVVREVLKLQAQGFRPDVVVAHPGWGEGLFLRDVFPSARHIMYCEYWYQGQGADVGFDPEFPATLDDRLRVRLMNSAQLLNLVAADQGLTPTLWQQQRFPAAFHSKIEVIHEGVDTARVAPDADAVLEIDGHRFRAGEEIVTFVARNLDPYRGFHVFLRALPRLQALRPQARILIVGGDEPGYGRSPPSGKTYRQHYCEELGDRVDWSRVVFTGKLPYASYLKVLQVSAAHVYLTYPFVLSWSMLEAMAAGCLLVGSDTGPVREFIREGDNGLLVDFFDGAQLATRLAAALEQPAPYRAMRARARETVVRGYDLQTQALPRTLAFLQRG